MIRSFFLFLLIVTQVACGQSHLPDIESAYSKFENDSQLKYGLSSLTVMNAQTGAVIFSKNGNTGMAPASTLKTVTSIAAFYLLGADFKWETTLGYTGSIVDGTLKGDLILTGGGDPSLGSDRYDRSKPDLLLNRWVSAIKTAGIKKIEGRIIGDDRLFGTQTIPLGWIWQDIGNYYGAGATSLSWKENETGVKFRAGTRPGDKTVIVNETALPYTVVNEVSTGAAGSGDNVYAYSAPYTDIIHLRGTYGIDLNKTIMISVPDPANGLVDELQKKIINSGIVATGIAITSRRLAVNKEIFQSPSVIIDRYSSPDLPQIVYWLNQKSLNLYAENILKTIALKQGKPARTESGIKELQKFWSSKLKIDPDALSVLDGSGLSPENRVTTTAMAAIMQSAVKEPWYSSFYESLPLNNAMKMKSGSIRNVLAYTGYHKSSSGNPLVFTFIVNNYNGNTSTIKQKMFKVLDELK